ncbi:phage lytic cycle repressor MrpR family protein [Bacillus safensis]|uniref:phage lytic cycle repressor MrpR family protein n=2 Tax=Bacillus safensis TaxID=561879 RepID=UPI002FFE214A
MWYNEEFKKTYLNTLNSDSQLKQASLLFNHSQKEEKIRDKDLFDFTTDEILNVLRAMYSTSLASLETFLYTMITYIDWSIANGVTKGSNNLARLIKTNDLLSCIDTSLKLYITKNELEKMCEELINAQDRALLRLLFEGVLGYEASEMTSLTRSDIEKALNNNNMLTVHDSKFGDRTIKVEKSTLQDCLEANLEKEYRPLNGKPGLRKPTLSLVDNEYVIKTKQTNAIGQGQASRTVVSSTFRNLKEIFGFSFLRPIGIVKSGLLYEGYKLISKGEELDRKALNEIYEDRKVQTTDLNQKIISDRREFMNEETIKKYYADELKKEGKSL